MEEKICGQIAKLEECLDRGEISSQEQAPKIASNFEYLTTNTYSCNGQTNKIKEYLEVKTGLEFVLVPSGSFLMGSEDDFGEEEPIHQVHIKAFLMSKCQISQRFFKKVMGKNPSYHKGENLPVEQVTWYDAQEFCHKTGLSLPSEAQWEYACRAGTKTKYYWGDEMDKSYCWYEDKTPGTHPGGLKKPNAFGLYDMAGNVWEWCQDTWHDDYEGAPTDGSAWVDEECEERVDRGGGWSYFNGACRSANRCRYGADFYYSSLGFRVVKELE